MNFYIQKYSMLFLLILFKTSCITNHLLGQEASTPFLAEILNQITEGKTNDALQLLQEMESKQVTDDLSNHQIVSYYLAKAHQAQAANNAVLAQSYIDTAFDYYQELPYIQQDSIQRLGIYNEMLHLDTDLKNRQVVSLLEVDRMEDRDLAKATFLERREQERYQIADSLTTLIIEDEMQLLEIDSLEAAFIHELHQLKMKRDSLEAHLQMLNGYLASNISDFEVAPMLSGESGPTRKLVNGYATYLEGQALQTFKEYVQATRFLEKHYVELLNDPKTVSSGSLGLKIEESGVYGQDIRLIFTYGYNDRSNIPIFEADQYRCEAAALDIALIVQIAMSLLPQNPENLLVNITALSDKFHGKPNHTYQGEFGLIKNETYRSNYTNKPKSLFIYPQTVLSNTEVAFLRAFNVKYELLALRKILPENIIIDLNTTNEKNDKHRFVIVELYLRGSRQEKYQTLPQKVREELKNYYQQG